jgi:hypothetical protein
MNKMRVALKHKRHFAAPADCCDLLPRLETFCEETANIYLDGLNFGVQKTRAVNVDGKQIRIVFAEGHGGGSTDGIGILPTRYGNFPPFTVLSCLTKSIRFRHAIDF